jgi:hypothetical protein
MDATLSWVGALGPYLVAAAGAALAVWRSHMSSVRNEAKAEGARAQLQEHNKDALKALHERLDRIEARLSQHHERLLARGILAPTTTGIPEIDS